LTDERVLSLLGKLHQVAQAIDFFEKRGRNDHHHYNFVQAVDVVNRVREELLSRKVIVLPGATNAQHIQYSASGGKSAFLTTVELTYTFYDVETGGSVEVPWIGVGADTGGDKGVYKAFTGGLKYALQTVFLVPTTDDPERDHLTSKDPAPEPEGHKDDTRPAAPTIPRDRAASILSKAVNVKMATLDMEAPAGTPPEFHPAFQAALALQGVSKIGHLNVDQAEAIERWLANEEES
jgi:hypothetical protein